MAKFDEHDYKMKKLVEALANRNAAKGDTSADFGQKLAELKRSEVPMADSELFKKSGKNMMVKGSREVIKPSKQALSTGEDFLQKIANLRKGKMAETVADWSVAGAKKAKKGLKSFGPIGALAGLGASLSSGDAAAAAVDMAVPGGIENIGPEEGTLEQKLETGEPLTAEERQNLNKQYRQQALRSKLGRQEP